MQESIATYAIPGVKIDHIKGGERFKPERILRIVANYFGLTLQEIRTVTRKQEILIPRQIAMYFYKRNTKLSLKEIGKVCGDKDHATILNASRSVSNMILSNYKNVPRDVAELELKLK